MTSHLLKLFTHPDDAWLEIRHDEEAHPRQYLAPLLLMPLIPVICLYIGITLVGWSLAGEARVRLDNTSALQLCSLLYLTMVLGIALMGGFVRWMSRTFEARPSLNQCIGFITYTATPFFVAGLSGLYPNRWLAVGVLGLAGLYATFLLVSGLPTFMRVRKEDGLLYAASVWGVGLLVLVTLLVEMILVWSNYLSPEYLRPASLG